jgi:Icc-related predicted phosphoesterase
MKTLAISDVVIPLIYSPQVRERFSLTQLVISCGDLPYYYQEYIISSMDVPLYFVRGNHDKEVEFSSGGTISAPGGGIDLHRRVVNHQGILMAGVEGSLRYRVGPFQYSQLEMWLHICALVPGMLRNRIIYGRYLDIFITHAPPRGVHDLDDLTHRGINAFRWLVKVFHPTYHLHGHIHIIKPNTIAETLFEQTKVINVYGFREINIEVASRGK